MAIRNFAKYIVAALAAVACTVQEPVMTEAPTERTEPLPSMGTVPGALTIQMSDELLALVESELEAGMVPTKSSELSQLYQDLGIESMERVFPHAGEFEERTRREGLHRFYTVRFREDLPVTKAAASLESVPGILSAEPQRIPRKRGSFDDPYFSRQWHYVNSRYSGADINVQSVWDNYTTGSESVVVCVVDEPVDAAHEDLKDNIWKDEQGHTGYNFARKSWDLSIRPENGEGDQGHGTHVAGTVGAVNNNGVGLCGIAGGDKAAGVPGVRLQSCAIFSGKKSASDAATCNAIKWGADHGALISQNSWGFYADQDDDGIVSASELAAFKKETISADEKAAIDYFIKYAGCDNDGNQLPDSPMKGGLVIFACGNEDIDYDVISTYEPVISVGAFGLNGKKASYSNHGSWVDIAAPGGNGSSSSNSIWSTLPTSVETGGYGGTYWAGTSMACPHVSGVAALIVSYFGQQGFTADDAKAILFGGLGDTIGGSSPIGKKMDAAASFAWALANGYTKGGEDTPDPPQPGDEHTPVIKLSKSSVELTYKGEATVKVTASDPDGDEIAVTCKPGSAALVYESGEAKITAKNATAGTYEAVFTATETKTEAKLSATAKLSYTILANRPPVITLSQPSVQVHPIQTVVLNVTAIDPDDDEVNLSCAPGSEALSLDIALGRITIDGSKAPAGTYQASFTAHAGGMSASAQLGYQILQNEIPSVVATPENALTATLHKEGTPIDMSKLFSDSDIAAFEDELTYRVQAQDNSIVDLKIADGILTWSAKSYGSTSISITATDLMGASATTQFQVTAMQENVATYSYPEVASTDAYVLVNSVVSQKVTVRLYSSTGRLLQTQTNVQASIFEPIHIDVSMLAPGRYSAQIDDGSTVRQVRIVKY